MKKKQTTEEREQLKLMRELLPNDLKFKSKNEENVCAWLNYCAVSSNDGNFVIAMKTLQDRLKLSRTTVSLIIKKLVNLGYFTVLKKGNNLKKIATLYKSNIEEVTKKTEHLISVQKNENFTLNYNNNYNNNHNHNHNNKNHNIHNNNNKELNNKETMIVNEMLYVTDKEFERRLCELEARYQMMMDDVVSSLEEKMRVMCENLRKKTTIINNLQQKVNELQQELKNVKVNAHAKTNISTPVKTNTNTGNRYENDTVLQLWKMLDDGVDVVSNFERLKMMKEQGRMSEKQWQRTLTKMNEFKAKQQRKSGNATTTTSTQNEQIPSDVLEKVNYAMWAVLKVQRAMNDGDDDAFLQWYSVMDDCRKWVDSKSGEYDNFKEFRNIKWIGHKVNDNRFQRFEEKFKKLNSKAKASA